MESKLSEKLKDFIIESGKFKGVSEFFKVDRGKLRDVFNALLREFKGEVHVTTITAIDRLDEKKIELDYEIWIYPIKKAITIKVDTPRDDPKVDSIIDLVPGALLYELEVHDLFGVKFIGNSYLVKPFIISEDLGSATPLRKDWRGPSRQ